MNRTVRTILVYGVVVVLMVVVAQTWFESGDQPEEITASEFVQKVETGGIEEVTIFTRSDLVTGEFVDDEEGTSPDFTFSYPPEWEGTLTEILVANQVPMTAESDTSIWKS